MAGAHLGTLPAFTNFILAATLGWETGAPAQGPTVLRLSLQCTDGETEGRTASKQNISVSDSALSPFPPELCGMSWLGALGPAGSFRDGWRCQHRGRVLGGPGSSPHSSSCSYASEKEMSAPDDSRITKFWISTCWKNTSQMLKIISHFFSNKKMRGNLSPGGEKRLQFSITTVVLFFLSASLLGR